MSQPIIDHLGPRYLQIIPLKPGWREYLFFLLNDTPTFLARSLAIMVCRPTWLLRVYKLQLVGITMTNFNLINTRSEGPSSFFSKHLALPVRKRNIPSCEAPNAQGLV
jgi:hypothetical protein